MMKKCVFLACIVLGILSSCQNDLDENVVDYSNMVDFKYKGVDYSFKYNLTEDSIVVCDNDEIYDLYNKLHALPELVTYVNEDENVEYFDNEKDFENSGKIKRDGVTTRNAGTIMMFKDTDYSGTAQTYYGRATYVGDKLNDEISSIVVFRMMGTTYLECFEHRDFGGKKIVFTARNAELRVKKLKDYHFSGLFKTWNDKITSFQCFQNP